MLQIGEWVLCTIQTQKKEESQEGSPAKVEETKGKGKMKAGNKKRKRKQEETEAENRTDEDPIQALHLVPMHPEAFAPEEGGEMGMFDPEYNSFPGKSSPVPIVHQLQHEPPSSETMSPCITDNNNYYGPNMAPTPCLQEPPHSEITSGGNYYDIASAGSNMMSWRGSPLLEMIHPAYLAGNTNCGFSPQKAPHMKMEFQTPSSFSEYNIDPSMATHHPATSYPYPPPSAFGYGGAAQNPGSHYGWYAGRDFVSLLSTSGSGFNFADSSQHYGGPSVPGPARA